MREHMQDIHYKLPVPRPTLAQRLKHAFYSRFGSGKTDEVYRVHFVYLVPSDREEVATAEIERCAKHLQRWYRFQMGSGKTFTLNDPVVQVFRTQHPASWYAQNNAGGSRVWWYWTNAQQELRNQCGGGFYTPFDDWVVYLDAAPDPDQGAGGTVTPGGYSGVCVLGNRDVAGVAGRDPEWSLCRSIGGCGHELGHTFGLPHPLNVPPEVWARAIMGIGYMSYPEDILLPENVAQLNGNPFFSYKPQILGSLPVCVFSESRRPQPQPHPHPTPHPRP